VTQGIRAASAISRKYGPSTRLHFSHLPSFALHQLANELNVAYRDITCHYSLMAKMGKPRGSRNKKTAARIAAHPPERHLPHWGAIVGDSEGRVKEQETSCLAIAISHPTDNDDSQLSHWSSDGDSPELTVLPLGMGSLGPVAPGVSQSH
jgi:hypothetical protein